MVHAALLCASLLVVQVGDSPALSHDFKTYEALKAKAGKDPQAQVKLALWCEAHGMNGERVKHLAQAVLSDPKNVTARGLLGLIAIRQPMGNGGASPRADQGGRRPGGKAG